MTAETIDPNRQTARATFHGKTLTDSQFDEAYAITSILERAIRKSGSFRDKLTDYAHAFARDQRFDALKGEEILRDVFKGRYGQSMNHMREGLMEREALVKNSAQDQALHHASAVLNRIKNKQEPFYRASDHEGVAMAQKHGITELGAKKMMDSAYETFTGRSLYAAGKEMEAGYCAPRRASERRANTAAEPQTARALSRSR